MQGGNDYAELCDLGPSRWSTSSRNYHPSHSSLHHAASASTSHIRSNSFEAEDIIEPYANSRIGNSTSSLRGRSGLYYSPPGTSYTIVERPHSPHYYYNTAGGSQMKGGSLPNRSMYLGSSSAHIASSGVTATGAVLTASSQTSSRHSAAAAAAKKRPISPEQVLRLFGTTTSSASAPSNYHYSNGGARDRGRRSPASSPPSTTHQVSCPITGPKFTHIEINHSQLILLHIFMHATHASGCSRPRSRS